MNEANKESRKKQIHRTWSRVLIDEVKEKVGKYAEEMKDDVVQNFIDFMESVDEKVRSRKTDKGFVLMVGRFKKMSEDDFKKMMKRQYEAFKESRVKDESEEDEIDVKELLKNI